MVAIFIILKVYKFIELNLFENGKSCFIPYINVSCSRKRTQLDQENS